MNKRVKVLYVSHFKDLKLGGQRSLTFLIENLDRNFVEPYALCPEPGELSERLEAAGCKCFFLPLFNIKPRNYFKIAPTILKLRKLLIKKKIDVVHPDHQADAFLCGLAKIGLETKMLWHVRWTGKYSKDFLHEALADKIVCVSDGAARRFSRKSLDSGKCETVYNGVDCEDFKPVKNRKALRKKLNIPADKTIFLFAGALKDGKGVFDILEALSSLDIEYRKKFQMYYFGSRHKEETFKKLTSLVVERGLGDSVKISPPTKEVHLWMQAADLLLIPSHEGVEGMPRVAIEAQACSTPVLGSDTSGVNEAITPDTGFLVSEKSPREIAEILKSILDKPAILEPMRKKCRVGALKRFDIRVHAEKIQRIYSEMTR